MKKDKRRNRILKLLPAAVTAVLFVVCLIFFQKADIEDVLAYTPHNVFLAALVLWVFYALKSLSIVFPATVFFIAAGHIYPYPAAVIVNLVGMAISFVIPYHVGKISGSEAAEKIIAKYPKAQDTVDEAKKNAFFASYAARAVTVLPNDAVSLLYGSLDIPFKPFLVGSLLGLAPEMLIETFIGGKLGEVGPRSALAMVLLAAAALFVGIKINRLLVAKVEKREAAKNK